MHKPQCQNIIAALNLFNIKVSEELKLSVKTGDLHNDSRKVQLGDIFCAIKGTVENGDKYIESAIRAGACLIISECAASNEHGQLTWSSHKKPVAILSFYQLNQSLFELAKSYYHNPQDKMRMIGITGTNGKTSTTQLIAQLLSSIECETKLNQQCAIIGTNGAGLFEQLTPLANTTPSATELHQLFYRFEQQNIEYVAMEVSSHALEQHRVNAELFDSAIFTNLSRDHLDYHGSMENYAAAKRKLFIANHKQIAILNDDDDCVQQWLKTWPEDQVLWLYGRNERIAKNKHYVLAQDIQHHLAGVTFTLKTHLGSVEVSSRLLGDFNIDNLLAAIAVTMVELSQKQALLSDFLQSLSKAIAKIKPIAGRMEAISGEGLATTVVDYAHTPDALEKALIACKEHCKGELFVIFGCGGDRDKGKRPLMAQAAEKHADHLIITNDNPRTESPEAIVGDMLTGIANIEQARLQIVLDRKKATIETLDRASANDIVLLAGKGHEDYIIIGNETLSYDERKVVTQYYQVNQTADEIKTKSNQQLHNCGVNK